MYLRLVVVALLFGACCTKKYCTVPTQEQQVKLIYQGYTSQELETLKIYLADKDFIIRDSVSDTNGDSVAYIYYGLFPYLNASFGNSQYSYIASVAGRRDTISSIAFDEVHEKIKCNQCFPAGDGRSDVTIIRNFRFNYKGNTIYGDSLVIKK